MHRHNDIREVSQGLWSSPLARAGPKGGGLEVTKILTVEVTKILLEVTKVELEVTKNEWCLLKGPGDF